MGILRGVALAACSFVLLAGGAARPLNAAFCPECWHFCDLEEGLDHDSACHFCSRLPVDLAVNEVWWHWCDDRGTWDLTSCEGGCKERCCTYRASLALAVSPDKEDLYELNYCPECGLFRSAMPSPGQRGACKGCDKPVVKAQAIARAWYWCAFESSWSESACFLDRVRGCCEVYTGYLPAMPVYGERRAPSPGGASMLVSTEWLEEHLGMEKLVVVHVGFGAEAPDAAERDVYSQAHIPGARRLAWDELVVPRGDVMNEIPDVPALESIVRSLGIDEKSRIVLYDTGGGLEAARAYVTFDSLGLGPRTSLLDGQWRKWKVERRESTSIEPEVEPSDFVAQVRSDVLIGLPALRLALGWSEEFFPVVSLVDTRAPGEYSGWRRSAGVPRPGHIPGATNVHWLRCVEGRERPLFRSKEELSSLFSGAGASKHRTLVVYCRTGVQASHAYFAAKYLGYRVRLYDGSFSEWSSQPELPVEVGSDVRSEVIQ